MSVDKRCLDLATGVNGIDDIAHDRPVNSFSEFSVIHSSMECKFQIVSGDYSTHTMRSNVHSVRYIYSSHFDFLSTNTQVLLLDFNVSVATHLISF